ncbi:MAG: glycoside hydrolase family 43 protein, partial [Duncaniella sp.]|nr:glycoside hydrolase family 43 protein [Duncaniella sp.]
HEDIASKPIADGTHHLGLKVESKGLDLSFSYSADGGKTWEEVATGIDGGFTSTAKAGGFTGTTIGLYASNSI